MAGLNPAICLFINIISTQHHHIMHFVFYMIPLYWRSDRKITFWSRSNIVDKISLIKLMVKIFNMKKLIILATSFCLTVFPLVSFAHPGRTDSSGCHTCKTNCPNWGLLYGEYHCHNSKGVAQPKEPIKSTYGENGTGHISPTPEYNTPKVNSTKTNTQTKTRTVEKSSWFSRLFNWSK